jgi:plasmid maintenance system antidote protein VapI
MSERTFAIHVGISLRTLNEILCDKRRITPRTAEKLALAYTQVPAETWNQRQQAYDAWKRAQARLLQSSTMARAGGATAPS